MIVSAEDSGRITLSDPRMLEGVAPIVLTVSKIFISYFQTGVRQSALKLSLDSVSLAGSHQILLTAGFERSISVLDIAKASA